MPTTYVVRQGDDGLSIALRAGFASFDVIWDDPANAKLRERRPNVAVFHPGDELTIPDRQEKSVAADEKTVNRFRVTIPKRELRFALRDQRGRPRAGVAYELEAGGKTYAGTTDASGCIEPITVRADVPHAVLRLSNGHTRTLFFGHFNPLRKVEDGGRSGVAQRLAALGFHAGASDGSDARMLRRAILAFQRTRELRVTGALSDELLDRLEADVGC